MDEREKALWRIVRAAQDVDTAVRDAFLDARCGGDATLRRDADAALASIELREHEAPRASRAGDEAASPHATSDDALLATRLGPFRLVERIGRGGMGVVYRGSREGADFAQEVAVKLVRRGFDFDDVNARFLRERRILARLDHPNLARFIDGGVAPDGRPWFALEYVRGTSLVRWCDEHRLSLRERVRLFLEVCAAVQHAHAQLVVHRDLKPANILVDDDGHVRLLDFGIARLLEGEEEAGTTIAGRYAFTPEYAAPEQFGGESAGVATDVYALGAILYELLSGTLPYALDRHDLVAAERVVRASPPLPLAGAIAREGDAQERLEARSTTLRGYRAQTSGDLSRILDKALAKEPARRYASVEAFADDLRRWLAGATVRVSGNGLGYRLRKFVARNRVVVGLAALAAFAVVAGLAATTWQMREARLQRDEAVEQSRRADRESERAKAESARAKLQVERLTAVNDFLGTLFSGADPNFTGSPNVTLAQALDYATAAAESDKNLKPQLAIRVMLAAANSYIGLNQSRKAEKLVRQALAIQESQLPDAIEDRGLLLSELAFLRVNYEPRNALRWAKEAVALQRKNEIDNGSALFDALSSLTTAQFQNGEAPAALATAREGIDVLRRSGARETDPTYIGALSNEALILTELKRYDEALRLHETVVRLRAQSVGENTVATWLERLYYAGSLRRAGRFADALAQVDAALPGLEREMGSQTSSVQQAYLERGIALLGLNRAAEAVAALRSAHVFGRTHDFETRQDVVGYYYAHALAMLERCAQAHAITTELAARKIKMPPDKNPFDGSPCKAQ